MFFSKLMNTNLDVNHVDAMKYYGKQAVIMLPYIFSNREEREKFD